MRQKRSKKASEVFSIQTRINNELKMKATLLLKCQFIQ